MILGSWRYTLNTNLLTLLLFILCSKSLFANEKQLDLTKLVDTGSYYGVYQANNKIGYAEFSNQIITTNDRSEFVQNAFLYMQYGVGIASEEIVSSETLYRYSFDILSRKLTSHLYEENNNYFLNIDDFSENIINETETGTLLAELTDNLQYQVTQIIGDEVTSRVSELPVLLVDDYFMNEYFVLSKPSIGDTINSGVYDLDFFERKVVSGQTTVLDIVSYKNDTSEAKHYVLENTDDYSPEKMISKYDAFAIPVEVNLGALELRLEPKNIAMDLSIGNHISTLGEMPLDKFINSEESLDEIYLELIGYNLKNSFIENERQSIVEQKNGKMLVKLLKGRPISGAKEEIDIKEFLKDTPRFNWKNENLKKINPYDEISGLDEIEKVKFLIDFTYNYIDYTFTLDATLDDIIKDQSGDCTEYAQLFIALARLNDIPAREVSGLIYGYDETESSFYGHAWAEVWLGNKWVEVDPGWNEFSVDASHLRLTEDFDYGLGNQIKLVSYK